MSTFGGIAVGFISTAANSAYSIPLHRPVLLHHLLELVLVDLIAEVGND